MLEIKVISKKSKKLFFKNYKLSCLILLSIFLVNFFIFVFPVKGAELFAIMPLGDSITRGEDMVGYRRELYVDLKNNGYG